MEKFEEIHMKNCAQQNLSNYMQLLCIKVSIKAGPRTRDYVTSGQGTYLHDRQVDDGRVTITIPMTITYYLC